MRQPKLPETMSAKQARVLTEVVEALEALDVDFALIGGLAVGVWGHERATRDIDFLVSGHDAHKLRGRLLGGTAHGITEKWDGIPVDFLFAHDEFIEELLPGYDVEGVPVIDVRALIYMKLELGRRRDQDDVVRLIRAGGLDVAACRSFLKQNASHLLEDFDAFVAEASLEES